MIQESRNGADVDGLADQVGGRDASLIESGAHERLSDGHPSGEHPPGAVRTLRQAMRRARHDDVERVAVQTDQRLARLCRLEMLQEALHPLIAQIPADVEMFDVGLMPGATPRLFIDMIGFVEMGRNARVYSFAQDTRHGRVQLAESADIDVMVEAVTDYVARRLLERDKALASDTMGRREPDRPRHAATRSAHLGDRKPSRAPRLGWFGVAFAFVIDLFGSIAFFTVLAGIGWLVWSRLHGQS